MANDTDSQNEEQIIENTETQKDDLGKELMQAIAFAHFAVEPYKSNDSDEHENLFYQLFHPEKKAK
jgi:hypothetical protein